MCLPSSRSDPGAGTDGESLATDFGARLLRCDHDIVVAIRGEIDIDSVEVFWTVIQEALTDRRRLVLDMSDATFMSAAGLRVLLRALEELGNAPDSVVLRSPARIVRRVLAISGVDAFLTIDDAPHAPGI